MLPALRFGGGLFLGGGRERPPLGVVAGGRCGGGGRGRGGVATGEVEGWRGRRGRVL